MRTITYAHQTHTQEPATDDHFNNAETQGHQCTTHTSNAPSKHTGIGAQRTILYLLNTQGRQGPLGTNDTPSTQTGELGNLQRLPAQLLSTQQGQTKQTSARNEST